MGTVFAATHKNNGMRAAIKVLHPEYARDSDTKSRFIQEGYAANQVGHAGVVRILDDDVTEEGSPYLVMELLEGELLEQRRIHAGGRLPVDEVIEVAEQLLDVIVAAHAKGIIHRDIKPDNIFVTEDGLLKVLDFGFARMRDGTRTERTATGFLLGTPGFMAPEQAAGHREMIDARTDIWAIGATLFMLASGQPVHEGETAAEMLVAAANFPVRPIGELERGLPVKLRQLIDRALAFDRNDRWSDAKAMLLAVRSIPGRQSPADEDQRTVMRASPASAHEDPTVMGRVDELPVDALESIYTPTSLQAPQRHDGDEHPADQEQRTLAIDPDGPTMGIAGVSPSATTQKVATQQVDRFGGAPPPPANEDDPSEHTVMMVSRPLGQSPIAALLSPHGAPPPPPSYPEVPPSYPFQPPITGPLPRLATTHVPGQAAKASKGGNLLIFIAVAGITMIVVILTGLVVIIGTE